MLLLSGTGKSSHTIQTWCRLAFESRFAAARSERIRVMRNQIIAEHNFNGADVLSQFCFLFAYGKRLIRPTFNHFSVSFSRQNAPIREFDIA